MTRLSLLLLCRVKWASHIRNTYPKRDKHGEIRLIELWQQIVN